MKLYTFPASPYGARVTMQIALKGLDIPQEVGPWPLQSEEFNSRFTLRKLPVLVLDSGEAIGDSWAILEYLENMFPVSPHLRPTDALALAQMHLLARYTDTHLGPQGVFPLFKTLLAPGAGDPANYVPGLVAELDKGDLLLQELPPFSERKLHLGDLALAPVLVYAKLLLQRTGDDCRLERFSFLCEWFQHVCRVSTVKQKLDELSLQAQILLDRLLNETA